MLTLFIAVLVVILVIYGLLKGAAPEAVCCWGRCPAVFTAWLRDTPLMVAEHSANWRYFDIFYLIGSVMSNRLAGIGLTIMTISGFARYMEHVGASHALFAILSDRLGAFAPLSAAGTGLPSLTGFGAVYSQPLRSGAAADGHAVPYFYSLRSQQTVGAGVIGCAQFIDHGPSGPVILAAELSGMDPVIYFVHHQLPVTLPIIAAVALSHYVVQRWWDRRETAAPLTEGVQQRRHRCRRGHRSAMPCYRYCLWR